MHGTTEQIKTAAMELREYYNEFGFIKDGCADSQMMVNPIEFLFLMREDLFEDSQPYVENHNNMIHLILDILIKTPGNIEIDPYDVDFQEYVRNQVNNLDMFWSPGEEWIMYVKTSYDLMDRMLKKVTINELKPFNSLVYLITAAQQEWIYDSVMDAIYQIKT